MVPDRRMVSMDSGWEVDPRASNGHVTNDVIWPQKVKLKVTRIIFEVPYLHNGAR